MDYNEKRVLSLKQYLMQLGAKGTMWIIQRGKLTATGKFSVYCGPLYPCNSNHMWKRKSLSGDSHIHWPSYLTRVCGPEESEGDRLRNLWVDFLRRLFPCLTISDGREHGMFMDWLDYWPIVRWLEKERGDLLGRPAVKTLCFHCRGHRFDPWSGK